MQRGRFLRFRPELGESRELGLVDRALISTEEVARVHLFLHIVQLGVVAVGDDGLGLGFEGVEVVHHAAAEEGFAVLERGFVDDDGGAFGFDALHHALDRTLAEVVGVRLHGEAENADDARAFGRGAEVAVVVVVVVTGHFEYAVGDEVFARGVRVDNGAHEVLRHVLVVGQELLGVLRQAVAAVAERGVVVHVADTGVETHAVNDLLGVESFHFGVGVELIEIADAQSEVGVGKQFHGLGFGGAHEEGIDVGLECALLKEGGKGAGGLIQMLVAFGTSHNDARGIEVVVESFAFAQKFGGEEEIAAVEALAQLRGVAYGNSTFDYNDGAIIDAHHFAHHAFDGRGVEEVALYVVVGRRGDDDKVGFGIGFRPVEGGGQVKRFFGEIALDIFVSYRRFSVIHQVYFLSHDIHGCYFVVLCQKGGDAQADIAGTGNGDAIGFHDPVFEKWKELVQGEEVGRNEKK